VPIEDVQLYHKTKHGPVLPPELVRQLATLVWRVLEIDGRESSYVDESNRFLTARIARLDNIAVAETNGRIDCYLIEEDDPAALRLKARRRLFSFEADDRFCPPEAEPDLWYHVAVTELINALDRHG
jgi:hypothetical protein